MNKLLNIGFDNYISPDKISEITQPLSAPIKRIIRNAKSNELIDCTMGRKTESVILTKDNKIILSSISREILIENLGYMKNNLSSRY
ncbi:DUF370 domain-containing protein [Clostridium arbusti]|uniref:DUF370 domain-containing protein n=1 Tax=Clostridium arbusti TaxID=1137848 RepID=UPI0002892E01|nr:DUF370 domain-containing protein [Clostridium arbusti]